MKLFRTPEYLHDTILYRWPDATASRRENWARLNRSHEYAEDYAIPAYPYVLQVEPTSLCNLGCTLCPTGRRELNRPYRNMSLQEFRGIVDDMQDYLLFLILWDWGEPFMNPDLPGMVRYAAERDIRTVTSTNCHFLGNRDYVEEILTAGLSTLIVAVDTLSAEQYEVYRKRGNLDSVLSGVISLMELRKSLKSKTFINLRMVVMRQNEHEVDLLRAFARDLGVDRFTVKTANPSCGSTTLDEELLPENPLYRRYRYNPRNGERLRRDQACRRIMTMSNIFSNGDVVPCCYDYDSEMKVGNAFETPFTGLWNSESYRRLREKIATEKNSIVKCRNCDINFELSKSGWFAEASDFSAANGWLREALKPSLQLQTRLHQLRKNL